MGVLVFDWYFRLLSFDRLTKLERNLTVNKYSTPASKFVFWSFRKPRWPLIDWDIFDISTTPKQNLTRYDIKQVLNGSNKFLFLKRFEKQDRPPGHWSAEPFSSSSLQLLYKFQEDLTWSKYLTSSIKFLFFGKPWWLLWYLIGWNIFEFDFATTDHNSTKLERKHSLNDSYQVYTAIGATYVYHTYNMR